MSVGERHLDVQLVTSAAKRLQGAIDALGDVIADPDELTPPSDVERLEDARDLARRALGALQATSTPNVDLAT